ncbi:hypothetical protein RhiirA1_464017 [Rhizophagus irregularis]|uniref:Uncharacterized protein n=1 Tax=Rhizophagus irregularis TaxID=588596 RepID=A0A2I1F3H2_9GLOM|nr:hypothetical protein RhiirA1_464017 [Rhizophagus irregularis]PKY28921.1 hypothetical protein RhiirB3_445313 [Rhizophagus irregularis]
MSQLTVDCLNEIFEYLEDDKVTLYSCLLVNHLWCEVSVRIYWNIIRNYNTLITCLPNESKEILYEKKIITLSLASKLPMFNYASFCKILSIDKFNNNLEQFLKEQTSIPTQNLEQILHMFSQEIFKYLMKISSIRKLGLTYCSSLSPNITFTSYIGARDCLKDLSELYCYSNICPQFFYQLSEICHNIQLFDITFKNVISNGLTDLISVQQNLKNLQIFQSYDCNDLTTDIITSFKKISNTVIILYIYGGEHYIPLSFISKFINLQEIIFTFYNNEPFEDFNELQYIKFSKLQYLEFRDSYPRNELLINFLMNNGKNLKEFYIKHSNESINFAIIKYCPNLRKLFTGIKNNQLETLKMFFESLKHLEYIKICCKGYFSEKILFDIIVKFSPRNFYELELRYSNNTNSLLLPSELESFLKNWENRESKKSLSLIIYDKNAYTFIENDEHMKIIEKYTKLGVIRNFERYN